MTGIADHLQNVSAMEADGGVILSDKFATAEKTIFFAVECDEHHRQLRSNLSQCRCAGQHGSNRAGVVIGARRIWHGIVMRAEQDGSGRKVGSRGNNVRRGTLPFDGVAEIPKDMREPITDDAVFILFGYEVARMSHVSDPLSKLILGNLRQDGREGSGKGVLLKGINFM